MTKASEPGDAEPRRQPWLHDLQISVHGNLTALCDSAGDMHAPGTGLFADDRRVVSLSRLTSDRMPLTTVSAGSLGGCTDIVAKARHLGDDNRDPTVEVRRERTLRNGRLSERVTLTSCATREVRTRVVLVLGGDGADLASVKAGQPAGPLLPAKIVGDEGQAPGLAWRDARHRTEVGVSAGELVADPGGGGRVVWPVVLPPGASRHLMVDIDVSRVTATPFDADPGLSRLDWSDVVVQAQDAKLDQVVHRSLTDLAGLLLSDPDEPADVFAAAGAPWFLTLFGRDSLWTARMTLPFGTELAAGTLRALARRQGATTDADTAEEPGKILHEVRRSEFADPSINLHLPPVYYGTVDATPLWVCLLHDAWRWGMPATEVAALRPALDRALGWLERSIDRSPDGLLRYVDTSGHGLSHQGWKDSADAMRFRDGSIARPPIALVETQAYAVQAALAAATLHESLFDSDADRWRTWARELATRVRAAFWVRDADGPYLAMALDAGGSPVDGVASNMGHALGTGMLSEEESRCVADRLTSPDLLGPYGIGTLGRRNPAFEAIGYHTGSVWPHDTAICALGLATDGHRVASAMVLRALVDAASHVDYRLPELFGGERGSAGPMPYPASCRPQAWAAAFPGVVVSTVLGLRADAPAGRLTITPMRPSPFGAVHVKGIRVAGEPVEIGLDASGQVTHLRGPETLSVDIKGG